MRDSFVFYRSFYDAIKGLPRDIQGEIYTAIMEYGLYGKETENLKPIAQSIFTLIQPQIEANNKRFENGKKGAEYGERGGRPKKNNLKETPKKPQENPKETPKKPQENPKETPNVNDNVNVNDISNTGVLDITRTRVKTQNIVTDIREHSDILLDKLQATHGLTAETARAIRDEILAEWEFQNYENTLSDARKHFCNLFAIKARRPPTQQKGTAPPDDWEEQIRRKVAYNLAYSEQLDKQNEQWKQEIYK